MTNKSVTAISMSFIYLMVVVFSFGAYSEQIVEGSDYPEYTKEASVFNKDTNIFVNEVETDVAIDKEEHKKVIPMGEVFGIKLYTDGVIVTALQEINTDSGVYCPARDAGIQPGDYIISINDVNVENNEHFSSLVSMYSVEKITLKIKRLDEVFTTEISPVFNGSDYLLGMWIRDSAAGIGTLTYVDPETGVFAGLGHGICDVDTMQLMPLKNGETTAISINHVERGEIDAPGKISGFFAYDAAMGTLYENTNTGIYGKLNEIPEAEAIEIALKDEVRIGEAQILTSIDNNGAKYFDVEIITIALDKSRDTKNFIVQVTDQTLLNLTGGIVQGMSGSPIIQDGKLVGAVTHVFVDDPTKGYGIFIENMLESAENIAE